MLANEIFSLHIAFFAISFALLRSATAAPTNVTDLTAAARAKVWPAAPDVCSTGPYHCLVVETKGNRGFKNLWCPNFTWEQDFGDYHVYAFNKGCEGNLALECLGKQDGKLHRGLTFFRFAPTSFFATTDYNIKSVTSSDQIFAASPPEVNNIYVNVPWVDILIECAWGPRGGRRRLPLLREEASRAVGEGLERLSGRGTFN